MTSIPECQHKIEDLSVELHIWRRTLENECRDLCAIFEFPDISDKLTSRADTTRWPLEAYIPPCNSRECDFEQSVLVKVVEVSQDSEQREEFFVRSIVRLHSLNGRSNWLAQGFKSPPFLLPELSTTIAYGEHKFPVVGRDFLSRLINSDCINKIVERAPQIMHDITGDKTPFLQRGFFLNSKDNRIPGKVSISFVNNSIRAFIHPGFDLILEGVEIFFGMFDAC